jgi:hypothetical protein
MARGVAQQPQLGGSRTPALLTSDPGAVANRTGVSEMIRARIDRPLGDTAVRDREGVVAVLEHVCFSCMISLAQGQRTPREVGNELDRSARLLLG